MGADAAPASGASEQPGSGGGGDVEMAAGTAAMTAAVATTQSAASDVTGVHGIHPSSGMLPPLVELSALSVRTSTAGGSQLGSPPISPTASGASAQGPPSSLEAAAASAAARPRRSGRQRRVIPMWDYELTPAAESADAAAAAAATPDGSVRQ